MDIKVLSNPCLIQNKIHFDSQVVSTNCVCKFECTLQSDDKHRTYDIQPGNVYEISVAGFNTKDKRVSCSLTQSDTTSGVFFFSDDAMERQHMDDEC